MSGPKVRPRLIWEAGEATDPSGVVLWWTRLSGNRHAELHHLKPYRGRLRVFDGHGALVLDESVRISRDGRDGPDPKDIQQWQLMLQSLPDMPLVVGS